MGKGYKKTKLAVANYSKVFEMLIPKIFSERMTPQSASNEFNNIKIFATEKALKFNCVQNCMQKKNGL